MTTKDKVQKFLMQYVPAKYIGYDYLKDALTAFIDGSTSQSNKVIFVDLATKYATDTTNIDRCLRTIVQKIWKLLPQLFERRPTTREFLTECAEYISTAETRGGAFAILERADPEEYY